MPKRPPQFIPGFHLYYLAGSQPSSKLSALLSVLRESTPPRAGRA
ncbi:MAG: hypothetical protein QM820_64675 [Minicystis sp.]